ncbi:MAG TPA: DUF3617 family protein [Caulobacteraceae bacterium]|jgi:hypothetical protein|nr:DUF3617 family protein [Caulobacteraceae bacterium]
MRVTTSILALAAPLLAIAALGACHKAEPAAHITPIQPTAAASPAATPGLWIERVSDRHGSRVTKLCLDAGAATSLASFNQSLAGHCSRHDMARAADGSWHFSTSCDMGPAGKVATEGVMRGDFSNHYVVEARSQTVGAAESAADGPGRVVADVRRAGDCPSDMKPGDVVMPDGARSHLNQLTGHA